MERVVHRIFSVRINLDDVSASLELCFTDADRSAWLRGFMVGCRGGQIPSGCQPMEHGHRMGLEAHAGAIAHQQRSSMGGRKSAQMHPENLRNGSGVNPGVNPGVQSESPSEQSNNLVIEESNNREIQQSNHSPESSASPPQDRGRGKGDDGAMRVFGAFWDDYAKKVGKAECLKVWSRMSEADQDAAMNGAAAYASAHPDPKYRKDPVRYLKGRLWEDEATGGEACPHPEGSYAWMDWHAIRGKVIGGGQ